MTAETGSVKLPVEVTELAEAVTVKSDSLTEPSTARLPVTVTEAAGVSSVNICSPRSSALSDSSTWIGILLTVSVVSLEAPMLIYIQMAIEITTDMMNIT